MDKLELYRWAEQYPETHAIVLCTMYERFRHGRQPLSCAKTSPAPSRSRLPGSHSGEVAGPSPSYADCSIQLRQGDERTPALSTSAKQAHTLVIADPRSEPCFVALDQVPKPKSNQIKSQFFNGRISKSFLLWRIHPQKKSFLPVNNLLFQIALRPLFEVSLIQLSLRDSSKLGSTQSPCQLNADAK
jgi:hypothetical protein